MFNERFLGIGFVRTIARDFEIAIFAFFHSSHWGSFSVSRLTFPLVDCRITFRVAALLIFGWTITSRQALQPKLATITQSKLFSVPCLTLNIHHPYVFFWIKWDVTATESPSIVWIACSMFRTSLPLYWIVTSAPHDLNASLYHMASTAFPSCRRHWCWTFSRIPRPSLGMFPPSANFLLLRVKWRPFSGL